MHLDIIADVDRLALSRCERTLLGAIDRWRGSWSTAQVSEPKSGQDLGAVPAGGVAEAQLAGAAFFGPKGKAIRAKQEQRYWCWAAAVQMLRRHLGLSASTQCEIASRRLGKPCCVDPSPCDVRLPFDQVTRLLEENEMRSERKRAALDKELFFAELFARRPILLADIFENGKDGHVRVAFGWQQLRRGELAVRVADPAHGEVESILFEELQRSWWQETWYRIEVLDAAS